MRINFGKNGILIIHNYVVKNLVAVDGVNYVGMIQGSIDRAYTTVNGKEVFPHIMDKAGSILYSMVRFHPFADGCKRTGLLTAYLFLFYNGYYLQIPQDSAKFLEGIAASEDPDEENELKVILWIRKHCVIDAVTILTNAFMTMLTLAGLNIERYTSYLLKNDALLDELREKFRDGNLEESNRL
ncbi:MAG: type II toxin-antitoxin system death-on-curing family toxin [Candidatus Bathyarchaeum tardum]|nr:MAG: type II toxin-antitoxin system death-on-curing family toxin [Candidatus Bathyarchaeum tardum]